MRGDRCFVAGLALAGVLLVGCGAGDRQGTTQGIDDDACATEMHSDALAALGGGGLSSFRTAPFGRGIDGCQALADAGPVDRITLVRAPATGWVLAAEPTLRESLSRGDVTGEHARAVERAVAAVGSGQQVSADEACALFSILAEDVKGEAADSTAIVEKLPRGRLWVLSAQACSDGQFTAITTESIGAPTAEADLRAKIRAALTELHPGPVRP